MTASTCGKTWWLDFLHEGKRHYVRLGKRITARPPRRSRVQRAAILKGEVGIGGPKRSDLTIDKAAELFLAWAEANKRRRTVRTYRQCIDRARGAFAGKRLGEISAFDLERYKRAQDRRPCDRHGEPRARVPPGALQPVHGVAEV